MTGQDDANKNTSRNKELMPSCQGLTSVPNQVPALFHPLTTGDFHQFFILIGSY